MGFLLLRLESFTLQMLWIAFCDSGLLWEICVDFENKCGLKSTKNNKLKIERCIP